MARRRSRLRSYPALKAIYRPLIAASLRATAWMSRRIPRRLALACGECLGALVYRLVWRGRRLAMENLTLAFGREVPRRELARIALRHFRMAGRMLLEVLRMPSMTESDVLSLVDADSFEPIERALARGKGLLVLTAHVGAWEILGAYLAARLGRPLHAVGFRLYYAGYNDMLVGARRSVGVETVYQDEGARPLLGILRRKLPIAILGDVDALRISWVRVQLFGHTLRAPTGPVALARASRAAIVPVFITWKGLRHHVHVLPEIELPRTRDKRADVARAAQRVAGVVEDIARRYPDQWLGWDYPWRTEPLGQDKLGRAGDVAGPGPAAPGANAATDDEGPRTGHRFVGNVVLPLKRVHIELTNVCEFNCTFCPKSEMTRPRGFMDKGLAKEIIAEIGRRRISKKITFHVMGEPTLHPDFFEILDHAAACGVNVGLTTNGRSLGGDVGRRLLDYDLHQVDVSLQTPDAGSFELRHAGRLTFDEYASGVMSFFSEYMARGHDSTFKFRFLNTRFRNKEMDRRKGEVRVLSTTKELRDAFRLWAAKIYDVLGVEGVRRGKALDRIGKLSSYRWNVVEVYPKVFFETYVLSGWGHAFDDAKIRDAWAGYCFGMRDHFAVLWNGDVTLCCIDYDGRTAVGNLKEHSLEQILSSSRVGEIVRGFRRFRFVHPHCRRCQGGHTLASWLTKPFLSLAGLKLLKPFFYARTNVFDA